MTGYVSSSKANSDDTALQEDGTNPSISSTSLESHNIAKWKDQDEGALLMESLEYLDTVTLIKKKTVCTEWKEFCTKAIDNKCAEKKKKKAFQSNRELRQAVHKYSPGYWDEKCPPIDDVESIASTYGYPIGKWDVSNVEDFSSTFQNKQKFNESIGSWDVSNAKNMGLMFHAADSFNQDISTWDVSNTTTMNSMFSGANAFNQDISPWDVSSATEIGWMFAQATSFNQDISSWNLSNVTRFGNVFFLCPIEYKRKPSFLKYS